MKRTLSFLLLVLPLLSARAQRLNGPETLTALLDSVRSHLEQKGIPGVSLAIVENDSVLFAGVLGTAIPDGADSLQQAAKFRMGSITKTLTSLCLIRLVREGKLQWEDKLADLAPEAGIRNPWEKTCPVRVVHLLEHTAGFDDMKLGNLYNHRGKTYSQLEQARLHQASLRSRWKPGTRMAYSNPGYVVAGYLIEKFSGKPYSDYVLETVFSPASMQHANLLPHPADSLTYAKGHQLAGKQARALGHRSIQADAAGALNASAADMAAFLRFMLAASRGEGFTGFSKEEIRRMERPATTLAVTHGLQTGYGLGNYPSGFKGPSPFHGHNGGVDGFISAFAYHPDLRAGYSLSLNAESETAPLERLLRQFLTRDAPAYTPPAAPLDPATISPFLGLYAEKSPRNALGSFLNGALRRGKLHWQSDTLAFTSADNVVSKLIHAGNFTFFEPGQNTPRFVLFTDDEGRRVLSEQGSYALLSPAWKWYANMAILGLAAFLAFTFLLVGLVFGILALARSFPQAILYAVVPAWTGMVSISTGLGLFTSGLSDLYLLTKPGAQANLIYFSTLYFGLASIAALLGALYVFPKTKSSVLSVYLLLVAGSMAVLAVFFGLDGMIGLQLAP